MSFLDTSYFVDAQKRADLVADDHLAEEQLITCREMNPYWQAMLGADWVGDRISPAHYQDPSSDAFAEDVRAWQVANTGFEPDGLLDDILNESFRGNVCLPPRAQSFIVMDGQRHDGGGLRIVGPNDPGGMRFAHGFYDRAMTPDLFVIHWDGCMSSKQCFNVLCARKLSVPFMLDNDGTVFQALDLAHQVGWHAGHVNGRALGVEIACPVLPERQKYCDPPRPITTMQVRGDTHKILGFYEVQLQELVKLLEWACTRFPTIPRRLPSYKGHLGQVANSYIKGPGETWDVQGFKGICGHYHQDDHKADPGMDVWNYLIENLDLEVVEVG